MSQFIPAINHPPAHQDLHEPWSAELARWYTHHYGAHPLNHETIRFAQPGPEEHLLDIGCGSGTAVREAGRLLTTGRAVGVDASASMVAIAEEKSKDYPHPEHIQFLRGNAVALPVADGSQTLVTAINSLHHWPDCAKGLSEVARVLIPGGRLAVCEEVFPEKDRGIDAPSLCSLLRANGFQVIQTQNKEVAEVEALFVLARKKGGISP